MFMFNDWKKNYYIMFFTFLFLMKLIFMSLMLFLWENTTFFLSWSFLNLNSMNFNFIILLDYKSLVFLLLVFLISSSILVYSIVYMENDLYNLRFIFILCLFVLSMGLLILSPSMLSLILGWDGLGLVSYCLVIHYQNFKSNSAGMLTALTNRVGDCLIIVSICYLMNFYSWNFLYLLKLDYFLMILVMIASMTKSAQIPFSSWLPAAMAAPTPVSSLVHSSTLVTAGVYLMIRFSTFMKTYSNLSNNLLLIGILTLVMSGISANLEYDFKKVIALSTLSQLGVMMVSISLGLTELAFFHLIMHALFKALLFMCTGNYIHSFFNNQDMRHYGMIKEFSPLTLTFFCIANLSLCGMPFLSGFYSKDLLLEKFMMIDLSTFTLFMFIMGNLMTFLYTFRILKNSVISFLNYTNPMMMKDSSNLMVYSMSTLFLFSIIMGKLSSKMLLFPMNFIFLPILMKTMIWILMVILLMLMISLNKYLKENFVTIMFKFEMVEFVNSLLFLVFISKSMLTQTSLTISKKLVKTSTNSWIEFIMGLKMIENLFSYSVKINYMNKNFIWMTMFSVFLIISFFYLLKF